MAIRRSAQFVSACQNLLAPYLLLIFLRIFIVRTTSTPTVELMSAVLVLLLLLLLARACEPDQLDENEVLSDDCRTCRVDLARLFTNTHLSPPSSESAYHEPIYLDVPLTSCWLKQTYTISILCLYQHMQLAKSISQLAYLIMRAPWIELRANWFSPTLSMWWAPHYCYSPAALNCLARKRHTELACIVKQVDQFFQSSSWDYSINVSVQV